jgi:hypothetical protein
LTGETEAGATEAGAVGAGAIDGAVGTGGVVLPPEPASCARVVAAIARFPAHATARSVRIRVARIAFVSPDQLY